MLVAHLRSARTRSINPNTTLSVTIVKCCFYISVLAIQNVLLLPDLQSSNRGHQQIQNCTPWTRTQSVLLNLSIRSDVLNPGSASKFVGSLVILEVFSFIIVFVTTVTVIVKQNDRRNSRRTESASTTLSKHDSSSSESSNQHLLISILT